MVCTRANGRLLLPQSWSLGVLSLRAPSVCVAPGVVIKQESEHPRLLAEEGWEVLRSLHGSVWPFTVARVARGVRAEGARASRHRKGAFTA